MIAGAQFPTIAQAARLIAERKLSPVELVQHCFARIDGLDDRLHSFLLILRDEALAAARDAEREIVAGGWRGPLHGIPIGLKDIFNTRGIRTTANSRILAENVPTEDATTVRKLRDAGAILMGKLTTHEFALGGPSFDLPWPPARNPWSTARYTGGSSSGTGAAIAAGLILGGTGSDTGGSIRSPAALCGVAGIKPTYGLVSRHGVLPLAFSLDHAGPMAWTAEDCAILLQTMAGHDPQDPASAAVAIPDYRAALAGGIKGLKIGVLRHFHETDLAATPAVRTALDQAVGVLGGLGAELRDITLSPLAEYGACGYLILLTEAYAVHEADLRDRFMEYGENFRDRCALGAFISGADYLQALRRRRELIAEFEAAIAEVDVIVGAAALSEAPRIDAVPKFGIFAAPLLIPFNVTGNPAMSICCGFSPEGLPYGLQIIGKTFDEATVLRVAHAYEAATSWRARRPPL